MSSNGVKSRMKKLKQYAKMSDEEYDLWWAERETAEELSKEFELRIKSKIDDFGEDYDLDDLKANDKLTLRALAQAMITLEDWERVAFNRRLDLGTVKVQEHNQIQNIMSGLRKDISNMQTDLNITRKVRKSDKDISVIKELDVLKEKAKEFYEQKMFYIWCPKCKMLLFTGWFLYPEEKRNKIRLVCNRRLNDEEICGNTVLISSLELLEKKGVNIKEIPDTLK